MRGIIGLVAILSILLTGCSGWFTQRRPQHRPETTTEGSTYFTAYDLLGRTIDEFHPGACPLSEEETARLEANGYTIVNGFARETDPVYGPQFPSWVCIDFAGPAAMRHGVLVATTHEDLVIGAEATFRPPPESDVETIYDDLEQYFLSQCGQCESENIENLICTQCANAPRIELATRRLGAVAKVSVGYFSTVEGFSQLETVQPRLEVDYVGF